MKIGLRILVVLGLLAFVAGLPVAAVAGSSDKIKFGHVAPPFHGQSKGVDAFAAYVKEKTNGRIDIATFPMGQLGGRTIHGGAGPERNPATGFHYDGGTSEFRSRGGHPGYALYFSGS